MCNTHVNTCIRSHARRMQYACTQNTCVHYAHACKKSKRTLTFTQIVCTDMSMNDTSRYKIWLWQSMVWQSLECDGRLGYRQKWWPSVSSSPMTMALRSTSFCCGSDYESQLWDARRDRSDLFQIESFSHSVAIVHWQPPLQVGIRSIRVQNGFSLLCFLRSAEYDQMI